MDPLEGFKWVEGGQRAIDYLCDTLPTNTEV